MGRRRASGRQLLAEPRGPACGAIFAAARSVRRRGEGQTRRRLARANSQAHSRAGRASFGRTRRNFRGWRARFGPAAGSREMPKAVAVALAKLPEPRRGMLNVIKGSARVYGAPESWGNFSRAGDSAGDRATNPKRTRLLRAPAQVGSSGARRGRTVARVSRIARDAERSPGLVPA
ncbi:unnamed protein product, partial [Amoebophrya sp. A120]|eukprot:GSA120T00009067001.1